MTPNEKRASRAFLNNVLLGASLYVLDSVGQRLAENIRKIGRKVRDSDVDLPASTSDVHSEVSERFEGDNRTILGNSRHFLETVGAAIIGVGVGVGIGVILAPASGEETRRNIEERVRSRFFEKKAA
jgi:hypothetical protein